MSLFHFVLLPYFLCLIFLRVLAGSVGRIGTKYMKVLNYTSDTVSHLNVIKGYTRRWGKMTSQIHRLTLHLTGYYKETQQSRHNAWQQKIENKCLQNDEEKLVFFTVFPFSSIMEWGGPFPTQTKIMTVIREMLWELCTGISDVRKHIDSQKPFSVPDRADYAFSMVFEENETSSAEISQEMCNRINIAHGNIWGNNISLTGSNLESPHFKCKSQQERAWPTTGLTATLGPRTACFQQLQLCWANAWWKQLQITTHKEIGGIRVIALF